MQPAHVQKPRDLGRVIPLLLEPEPSESLSPNRGFPVCEMAQLCGPGLRGCWDDKVASRMRRGNTGLSPCPSLSLLSSPPAPQERPPPRPA